MRQDYFDHRNREPAPDMGLEVDPEYIESVSAHVERTVGPHGNILHELVSTYVHIDILQIPPDIRRHWTTLVTCGMGSRRMEAPPGNSARMELAVCLPPDWPSLDPGEPGVREEGDGNWIVDYMQFLARLPFQYQTWYGIGHTIPNGDPPEPLGPESRLVCAMLARPKHIRNPEFRLMRLPNGETVNFLSVVFLTREEMEYKLRRGSLILQKKLNAGGVDELLQMDRQSTCRGGWWERMFG